MGYRSKKCLHNFSGKIPDSLWRTEQIKLEMSRDEFCDWFLLEALSHISKDTSDCSNRRRLTDPCHGRRCSAELTVVSSGSSWHFFSVDMPGNYWGGSLPFILQARPCRGAPWFYLPRLEMEPTLTMDRKHDKVPVRLVFQGGSSVAHKHSKREILDFT